MTLSKYNCLSNVHGKDHPVEDDLNGRWCCSHDKKYHRKYEKQFWNFLELHPSSTWNAVLPSERNVVFRVSLYNSGSVLLGDCVLLNRDQLEQLRDRVDELLSLMK